MSDPMKFLLDSCVYVLTELRSKLCALCDILCVLRGQNLIAMNTNKIATQSSQRLLVRKVISFYFFAPAIVFSNIEIAFSQDVNDLKLKDYHPLSIYNIPQTKIE